MKYLSIILFALVCVSVFPQRTTLKPLSIEKRISHKDSVVVNGKVMYFDKAIDSILVFKDKIDNEYHTLIKCPCIDGKISSHFLGETDIILVKKNLCPLCQTKSNYIKAACDSIIARKKKN